MRNAIKYILVLCMLAACGQDPSPEGLMQPEMLDVTATVLGDGSVSFSCTMNDTRPLTDCGFVFSADGVGETRLQGEVVDGRHFSALSPVLTAAGQYEYSAFAGNGRTELHRIGGFFDIAPVPGDDPDTPDDPDDPDDPDNPDDPNNPEDPDTPETPPTPPAGPKSMILRVDSGSNGWVYLPLHGAVDVSVDWGDGTVEAIKGRYSSDDWPSHKFAAGGVYEVCIAGSSEVVSTIGDSDGMPYPEKMLAVKRWGDLGASSYVGAFKSCEKLSEVAADTLGVFRQASIGAMFFGCTSLKTVPDSLFAWYGGESMSGLFYGCTSLESVPPHIFAKCTSVTNFDDVFMQCASLVSLPESLFADCTNVDSFHSAFRECVSLKSVPVSLFDNNRKVRVFTSTFQSCNKVASESPYTIVESVKVHIYERQDYRQYFSNPSEHEGCFSGAPSALAGPITSWTTPLWADYSNIPQSWKW